MGWIISHAESIAVALFVAAFAWVLHDWSTLRLENTHRNNVEQAEAAVRNACNKNQTINKEVDDAYQTKMDALAAELAAARRVPTPACIPLKRPACVPNPQAGDAGLPRGDEGISRDYLLDFAYRAEQVGLQLDALQDWVSRTAVK